MHRAHRKNIRPSSGGKSSSRSRHPQLRVEGGVLMNESMHTLTLSFSPWAVRNVFLGGKEGGREGDTEEVREGPLPTGIMEREESNREVRANGEWSPLSRSAALPSSPTHCWGVAPCWRRTRAMVAACKQPFQLDASARCAQKAFTFLAWFRVTESARAHPLPPLSLAIED